MDVDSNYKEEMVYMEKQIYGYIYMIRNKVNGKLYFGKTENNFDTRYRSDISKHTHNKHLKRSIEKYGIENFEINEQFDVAYTEDDLWDLEDMYICIYNCLDSRYGYNKRRSGSKHKGNGKLSRETRQKMSYTKKETCQNKDYRHRLSKALEEKWKDENYIEKQREAHRGKQFSDEHRQNLSKSHIGIQAGNKHPMYGRTGNKNPMYGRTGDKHPMAKTVICIETGQVFTTVKEAGEWCKSGHIRCQIIGKRKTAGKHPVTGEKLHWMYYEEWLKLQDNN